MREVREDYLLNLAHLNRIFRPWNWSFRLTKFYMETKPFLNKVLVAEIPVNLMTEIVVIR